MTAVVVGTPSSVTIGEGQTLTLTSTQNSYGSISMTSLVPGLNNSLTNANFGPTAFTKTFGPYSSAVTATITLNNGSADQSISGLSAVSTNVVNTLSQAIKAYGDGLRTRPPVILGVGDSNFSGEGSGTSGSNNTNGAFVNNPIQQIPSVISTIGNLPIITTAFLGEGNILTSGGTVTGYNPQIVMTGGWAAGGGPIFFGGRQLVTSSTVGELTWSPGGRGDTVEIYSFQNTAGSTSVNVLSSDGVVRGNFSCNSADTVLASTLQRFTFTSTAFRDGVVRIQNAAAGDATIFGIFTYPSDTKNVLLVKGSYCTGASANFASVAATYSGMGFIPTILPDYAITQITINDILLGTATATYNANLVLIYTILRRYCDVLSSTGGMGGGTQYTNGSFRSYEYELNRVSASFGCPVISFHKRDDNWVACNLKGYAYNQNHKTQLGYFQQSKVYAETLRTIAG